MFVADANVLIDAAQHHSPYHLPCKELVESWRNQGLDWFVTWGICFEFLRVATHPSVYRSPASALEAWNILEALFSSGLSVLTPTQEFPAVVADYLRSNPQVSGNIMHDLHIALLMQDHGIRRIYTRDTDFHRFPFLEVIDPLKL